MKIVIVGNGKVGHTLAEQLSREDHDIVLVDNNSKAVSYTHLLRHAGKADEPHLRRG